MLEMCKGNERQPLPVGKKLYPGSGLGSRADYYIHEVTPRGRYRQLQDNEMPAVYEQIISRAGG